MSKEYIAIHDGRLIGRGDLKTLIRKTKSLGEEIEPFVLEWENCRRIEFSWRGDADSVIQALEQPDPEPVARRGRPKLGVKAKEVTLLPRHWEWLATQRGGASVTLRRLVDHAMKHASPEQKITEKQNQLYALISIFADEPGFEEASRAMYRNSRISFTAAIASWPEEIRTLMMEKFDEIGRLHDGPNDDQATP